MNDSVLNFRLPRVHVLEGVLNALLIVRVNGFKPGPGLIMQTLTGTPPNLLVGRADVEYLARIAAAPAGNNNRVNPLSADESSSTR